MMFTNTFVQPYCRIRTNIDPRDVFRFIFFLYFTFFRHFIYCFLVFVLTFPRPIVIGTKLLWINLNLVYLAFLNKNALPTVIRRAWNM